MTSRPSSANRIASLREVLGRFDAFPLQIEILGFVLASTGSRKFVLGSDCESTVVV